MVPRSATLSTCSALYHYCSQFAADDRAGRRSSTVSRPPKTGSLPLRGGRETAKTCGTSAGRSRMRAVVLAPRHNCVDPDRTPSATGALMLPPHHAWGTCDSDTKQNEHSLSTHGVSVSTYAFMRSGSSYSWELAAGAPNRLKRRWVLAFSGVAAGPENRGGATLSTCSAL